MEWLDGKLSHLLCLQPVTRSGTDVEASYSYSDYRNAQRLGVAGARDPAILKQARNTGQPLPADIEASAAATLTTILRGYYRDLSRAIEETAGLAAVLTKLCGDTAPSMVGLRNRLSEIQGWIHTTLCAKGEQHILDIESSPDHGPAFSDEGEDDALPPHRRPPPTGPIRSAPSSRCRSA